MIDHNLRLKDFRPRSALVTKDSTPARARFPVVDAHNHLGYWDPYVFEPGHDPGWTVKDVAATITMMDDLNIRCMVDLDGGWGDQLQAELDRYKAAYPDRFCVFAWVDWSQVEEPGFGEKWARELEKEGRRF